MKEVLFDRIKNSNRIKGDYIKACDLVPPFSTKHDLRAGYCCMNKMKEYGLLFRWKFHFKNNICQDMIGPILKPWPINQELKLKSILYPPTPIFKNDIKD